MYLAYQMVKLRPITGWKTRLQLCWKKTLLAFPCASLFALEKYTKVFVIIVIVASSTVFNKAM